MWLFDNKAVPSIKTTLPGPKAQALLERDQQYMSPSYTRIYPLVCERGSGAVIEDVDGNLFLDFTAGIAVTATGHCHPDVVAAIQDQAGKLIHMSGTDFYYQPQIDLAQRLTEVAPGVSPKRVFFTNSGAEALEAGLKLARWHTGRSRAIAFFGAFHGRTYGAMSLSGSKLVHRRGFSPLVPDIHHIAFPRGCKMCSDVVAGCACVKQIEDTVLKRVAPPDEVAAIFVEPIQGEGGYHVSPPGFLPGLRDLCDKYGILLVVDEVQSGMGRTGRMFAVEHWDVEPDIICLAKGIASGMPLAMPLARQMMSGSTRQSGELPGSAGDPGFVAARICRQCSRPRRTAPPRTATNAAAFSGSRGSAWPWPDDGYGCGAHARNGIARSRPA